MALQLWLPLNGDVKNYGLKNINVLDHGTSEYNQGKIGKCRSFVGSGYLELTNSFGIESGKDFSCCYWIKEISNNTSPSFRVVYQCGNLIIGHYNDCFNIYNGRDSDFVYKCDTTDWVHCCLTYQSSDNIMTIYINGIKCSTHQPKNLNNLSSTTALIGKRSNESYLLEGYLNDFRLYDECLSPKQIKYISQAMICHYPMGNVDGKIGGRNLCLNTGNSYTMGYGISNTSWINGYAYIGLPTTINNFEILPQGNSTYWRFLKNETYTQTIWLETDATIIDLNECRITWFRENDGHDVQIAKIIKISENSYKIISTYTMLKEPQNVRLFDIMNLHNALDIRNSGTYLKFGKLKIEKGTKSTPWTPAPEDNSQFYDNIIPDISGYRNNATVKDSTCPTWSDDSPRYLGSYEFNGENQYISGLSPVSNNTKEFTISFWTKLNNTSGAMTFYTARKGIGSGVALFFVNKNIRFDDNAQFTFNYTCDFSSNKWTHLCVTRNNTSKKLYINGKLVDSTSKVGDMQNIGQHFTIGGSSSYGNGTADFNWLNGKLSDFRIYSTVLSDEDVLDLYQSSASLDSQGNLMLTGEVIE